MTLRAGGRSTKRTRLVGSTATVLLGGVLAGAAPVAAAEYPVGHDVQRIVVPGSAQGEPRQVDVHLWYPATASTLPKTVYTSALHGVPVPAPFAPLGWTVEAELAQEDAPVAATGKPFGVIVFSHGNTNDPMDYAHTLERIAAGGFVVAAPSHTNNTQEDARIDAYNALAGATPRPCNDGRAGPCSRASVPFSMADRTRDVSKVLDALPGWFGSRIDVAQAGLLGHSRGTLTALATAGGSAPPVPANPTCSGDPARCWPLTADPRVVAVMGMAIGQQPISLGVDYKAIKVPTLLVSAAKDLMSPPLVSQNAYAAITSADKRLVSIPNGVHRSFDSTYCDQMQAAGRRVAANADAALDRHTFERIVTSLNSGWGTDFCSFASFAGIEELTRIATGGFTPTATNVPVTGLDTDAVKEQMAALAVDFFGTRLARVASGGVSGTVPATLALTLGTPASFGAFVPGVDRTYDASTRATVTSTAGSAQLSVGDPSATATGRLVNGNFALDQPLQVRANGAPSAPLGALRDYAGPVSNDVSTVDFRQTIARTQPLRTGVYSKTLTFTLSTTAP
ncbi:hypothetical protein OJ997_26125 [Solirubrobacter phytolaccae]|uniref:Alpha/beta hydrolase n=1 Tax=Solirubrobacter phytolaccae TaxID=1404360 RepID=A0A9X3NF35_9ACTN|nr:hypothetical protein [Solirubrobacter phytolaccae]MDA0183810.1 hypothetical protein [Solirubrobacter phytolaccae]